MLGLNVNILNFNLFNVFINVILFRNVTAIFLCSFGTMYDVQIWVENDYSSSEKRRKI